MSLGNKDRGQWIILVTVVSGILFVAVLMLKRVPVSYYAYIPSLDLALDAEMTLTQPPRYNQLYWENPTVGWMTPDGDRVMPSAPPFTLLMENQDFPLVGSVSNLVAEGYAPTSPFRDFLLYRGTNVVVSVYGASETPFSLNVAFNPQPKDPLSLVFSNGKKCAMPARGRDLTAIFGNELEVEKRIYWRELLPRRISGAPVRPGHTKFPD